jgi:hypothetical protein
VGRGHEVDVVVLAAVVLDSSSRVLLSKRKNDAGIQYAFHLFSVFMLTVFFRRNEDVLK